MKTPNRRTTRRAPSIRSIGETLVAELGEIIDELGPDHPDLTQAIVAYITQLDERHPEWRVPMERARARLVGGAWARTQAPSRPSRIRRPR